jgi:glycosyltransferase involved in cell wall biosynthesis
MAISVVIPSYNHAPYLRECLDSVLGQTRQPDEVIVVDDGSTDESWQILQSYGGRIQAFRQENQGTYATLNTAISRTKGDWIAIQNSDDAWMPEKLEKQARIAEEHSEVGLIHTGIVPVDSDGSPLSEWPEGIPIYHAPPVVNLLPKLIHYNCVMISSTMIRREAWDRYGPFDENYFGCGDWDLCLKISQAYAFGFVDEPLTLYRKHTANASTDTSRLPSDWGLLDWKRLRHQTVLEAVQILWERAKKGEIPRAEASHALACLGTRYLHSQETDLARRMYALSIQLLPLRLKSSYRYLMTYLPYSVGRKIE